MGSYYSVTNWDAHPSNFFNPSKPPCSDFKDLNQRSGINVTVKVPEKKYHRSMALSSDPWMCAFLGRPPVRDVLMVVGSQRSSNPKPR